METNSAFADIVSGFVSEKIDAYQKRFGDLEDMDFAVELIKANTSYANMWRPETFSRVKLMRDKMLELAEKETPLPGHLLFTDLDSYNCCESGIINNIYGEWGKGEASICKQGSCHISGFEGDAPITSISGGHFFRVKRSDLKPFDFYPKQYWIWGETPCASGGIYFTVPMRRWKL